jgi:chloramphenicol-sensitive protein RarD
MKKNLFKGISFTVGASIWWGVIGVIYFKFVSFASPVELTIHRTIWTALLLLITTSYYSKWSEFKNVIKKKNKCTDFVYNWTTCFFKLVYMALRS